MSENFIDYEQLLSEAKSKKETLKVLRKMDEAADNIQVIPSKDHQGAFELFFVGLKGVDTSFLVFNEEQVARRFMVSGPNDNDYICVFIGETKYYVPFATYLN